MSNRKYVCFNCRTSVRREANSDRAVKCPFCGADAVNIGYKIPIPLRTKIREWQALEQQLVAEAAKAAEAARQVNTLRIHALEKEIAKLEALPENEGRTVLIKQLKKELKRATA